MIRGVIVHELRKLKSAKPELKGWGKEKLTEVLDEPEIDPNETPVYPLPEVRFGANQSSVSGSHLAQTEVQLGPNQTSPTPAPAPAPSTSGSGHLRIADNGDENPSFAEFYSEYPRREARKNASTAFSKAIAGGADPQTIIAKAKIYAQAVKDHERKHIALPATWLNGERWDDEIELPPTGSEGGPSIWDRIQPRQNEG